MEGTILYFKWLAVCGIFRAIVLLFIGQQVNLFYFAVFLSIQYLSPMLQFTLLLLFQQCNVQVLSDQSLILCCIKGTLVNRLYQQLVQYYNISLKGLMGQSQLLFYGLNYYILLLISFRVRYKNCPSNLFQSLSPILKNLVYVYSLSILYVWYLNYSSIYRHIIIFICNDSL